MKVTILRGISGSGKSTYATKHHPNAFVVSADSYHMANGVYAFDPANLSRAHAQCLRSFTAFVTTKNGTNDEIVVDNTNTTVVEIAPYAALALAYGCELEIITLDTPLSIAWKRNIHGVSPEVATGQWKRLFREIDSFPRWWPHRIIAN